MTGSEEIRSLIKQLGVSEPIFKLQIQEDNKSAKMVLLRKYEPNLDPSNPIARIVNSHYSESLNKNNFTFDNNTSFSGIFARIISNLGYIYKANCKLKKPENSVLFKWLGRVDSYSDTNEIDDLIALYKYISPRVDERFKIKDGINSSVHKYFISILEHIRAKYGKEK